MARLGGSGYGRLRWSFARPDNGLCYRFIHPEEFTTVKFYLRMEAVNIAQFLEDCEDLSTIRGGALLLLDSPRRLAQKFPLLKEISLGGSQALFEFDASPDEASQLRNDAERMLASDSDL